MSSDKVQLPYGLVKSNTINIQNKEILEFLSIPYVKAPIGNKRFSPPEPLTNNNDNIDTIINHSTFKTCPPQISSTMFDIESNNDDDWTPIEEQNEDCLYINVWCPKIKENKGNNIPVLFWIYGGGYISGSSTLNVYNGQVLCAMKDVIVVSFNYRVGMLGFLNLGGFHGIYGNQGILDQIEALKWTYNHINLFGGDKSKITLAGNSAGGCSVTLHLLIEQCWSMINGVIIESGVCFSDWAFCTNQESINRSEVAINKILIKHNYPKSYSNDLNDNDKNEIVQFLYTLNHTEFVDEKMDIPALMQFYWSPSIDKALFHEDPRSLFLKGHYKKCPIIFLNVENECDFFLVIQFSNLLNNSITRKTELNENYLIKSLPYYPHFTTEIDKDLLESIKIQYGVDKSTLNINLLDKILSHRYFVCDSIELCNIVSRDCPTYYWWFNVKLPRNLNKSSWPSWIGVMHSDEIFELFGNCFRIGYLNKSEIKEEYHELEKSLTLKFMDKVAEFVYTGALNDEPLYDLNDSNITMIERSGWSKSKISDELIENCDFWKNVRLKYNK